MIWHSKCFNALHRPSYSPRLSLPTGNPDIPSPHRQTPGGACKHAFQASLYKAQNCTTAILNISVPCFCLSSSSTPRTKLANEMNSYSWRNEKSFKWEIVIPPPAGQAETAPYPYRQKTNPKLTHDTRFFVKKEEPNHASSNLISFDHNLWFSSPQFSSSHHLISPIYERH